MNNKVVALVGMTGSGKSIATTILEEEKGWTKVYFGGITYDKMKEEGIEYTPENDKKMRVRIREEYGMAAYAILSLPKIEEGLKKGNVVIDGLYSWSEYKILEEKYGEDLIVIAVITDKKIRYERLKIRKSRPYTTEEAKDRDLNELEKLEKGGPISFADYYIDNNYDKETYRKRLEEILKEIR